LFPEEEFQRYNNIYVSALQMVFRLL